jgi:hypothetical protein
MALLLDVLMADLDQMGAANLGSSPLSAEL